MIPPIWVNIRISWFWLPLPVILLWPIIAIFWIILGLGLTAFLLGTGGKASNAGIIWIESWRLLCALRGTSVEVDQVPMSLTSSPS